MSDTPRTYKCFKCEHEFGFGYMYRCFDCKVWLCEDCTRSHFGNQHEPHPMHLHQWEEKLSELEACYKAVHEEYTLCRKLLMEHSEARAKAERRLRAMLPLFEEARDAITSIPLATAKLRGLRLDLADRMDDVGVPERWVALLAAQEKP